MTKFGARHESAMVMAVVEVKTTLTNQVWKGIGDAAAADRRNIHSVLFTDRSDPQSLNRRGTLTGFIHHRSRK